MKNLITLAFMAILLASCGSGESTLDKLSDTREQVKDLKKNAKNASSLLNSAEEMQNNMKKLQELKPISKEVIKDWMPENVDGLQRTKYTIGKHMGMADVGSIELEFKPTDTESKKSVRLKVVDCAGPSAAMLSAQLMIMNIDIDSEDEQGYERTEVFDNQKILVKHKDPEHGYRTNFNYQIEDRLLVEAKGINMDADELWRCLKEINIEKLLK